MLYAATEIGLGGCLQYAIDNFAVVCLHANCLVCVAQTWRKRQLSIGHQGPRSLRIRHIIIGGRRLEGAPESSGRHHTYANNARRLNIQRYGHDCSQQQQRLSGIETQFGTRRNSAVHHWTASGRHSKSDCSDQQSDTVFLVAEKKNATIVCFCGSKSHQSNLLRAGSVATRLTSSETARVRKTAV